MSRKRKVIAVGRQIGKRAPPKATRKRSSNRVRPRVSDIPKDVRQQVKNILVAHERWGQNKHVIAADALIRLSAKSAIPVSTLTYPHLYAEKALW